MSDEGKPITPEHIFKRIIWRNALAIGATMEQFTTWTITGIAAIVGLIITHLDSVTKIVSPRGLQWSIIMLAFSLLAGVLSKNFGMMVAHGLVMVKNLETFLYSEDGLRLMSSIKSEPRKLIQDIASPFLWPISIIMRRGGEQGIRDYSAADRRFIRLFCIQLYLNLIHGLLATVAIIILALSIQRP